jgi:excisionase family DNA binding protein
LQLRSLLFTLSWRLKNLLGIKCFVLSCSRLYFSKDEGYTGETILAQIMTTKEIAKYLKLHQITICKLSKEGRIPSIRIGRVWRFDKDVIDAWIAGG